MTGDDREDGADAGRAPSRAVTRLEGRLRRLLTRAHHVGVRLVVSSGLEARRDRHHVRSVLRHRTTAGRTHVVLTAPGAGNIGDQAMVEALLELSGGPVVLVVGDQTAAPVPEWAADRVQVRVLRALLPESGPEHAVAVDAFAELLTEAAHLSVIGADVMDGRYSLRSSVNRASLAAAAAAGGLDTRVVGFSWNGVARWSSRRTMRRAGRAGVRLMARDPVSLRRLRADRIVGVEPTADIVFGATTVDPTIMSELVAEFGLDGVEKLAVVNASGLIARDVDQVQEYVQILDALRQRGLHVLLLPHVSRDKGDDLAVCDAIAARFDGPGVTAVRRLLPPAQVRGLTDRADVVITGRMHLAVMSFWATTPAIALATQGKVEGLMEHFGVPQLCVEPSPGFGARVVDLLDQVLPADAATRTAIGTALPRVVELARHNVDGLPHAERRDPANGSPDRAGAVP